MRTLKIIHPLILLFFSFTLSHAQPTMEWAKTYGGKFDDKGNAIAIDLLGNVYVAGHFYGTIEFQTIEGITKFSSMGSFDVFIAKFDPMGNVLWAKQFGGIREDIANGIAVDDSGNTVITGFFRDDVDMDPGLDVYTMVASGVYDGYISKFDASRNFLWSKQMSGGNQLIGCATALDKFGNIFVTGRFLGAGNFDPNGTGFKLRSKGEWDMFITKWDKEGNLVWAKNWGGPDYDQGYSIAIDDSGNVYSTGNFKGMIVLEEGESTINLFSAGSSDVYVFKLNPMGTPLWAKRFGGKGNDIGKSIALDAKGNIWIAGNFEETLENRIGNEVVTNTSAGISDAFITHLDASGNTRWVRQLGGKGIENLNSITADTLGNVYATGYFRESAHFDLGGKNHPLNSTGEWDIFITKIDSNGTLAWAKQLGANSFDEGNSIKVDAMGSIYLTGYFQSTINLDPTTENNSHTSKGNEDIFVIKMRQ